jgi:phage shock protein C
MTTAPESTRDEQSSLTEHPGRLYRSSDQKVVAGVCGGLGEYFGTDPIWFRIAFVVLAIGGGSGILAYLIMWLVVEPRPDGLTPSPEVRRTFNGGAVLGLVFIIAGTIALVNMVAPWMGQYIWPVVFVLGGLALLLGGLNHDNH